MIFGAQWPQVAINFENNRLGVVTASVSGKRLVVKSWLTADLPKDVASDDAGAVGKWMGSELRRAGMHRAAKRGVIFAVPRGEVVLKRMTLPPGCTEDELPGIVQLQMRRQLTVGAENAAVDYVSLATGSERGDVGRTVLCGALQSDRIAWRRSLAKAAGVRLSRVALKSAGASTLLAEASQRRSGATLGISLGRGSSEFVIVEDGQLVFVRATDLIRPEKPEELDAFAQRLAVEAKRTWMSYRVTPEGGDVEAVTVLGTDETAVRVAERCAGTIEMACEAERLPGFVEVPDEMPEELRASLAPLMGLLAEGVTGRPALDFAHPRRAPDRRAAVRQRVLLAAMVLIVGGGAAYTAAKMDLQAREQELEGLKGRWAELHAEYQAFLRERARAEHFARWSEARLDWRSHLTHLASGMPDPREAQLDRLAGRADGEVLFGAAGGAGGGRVSVLDGRWSDRVVASISLSGRVRERETADALRQSLVTDTVYRVTTPGPDLPDRFSLQLTTRQRAVEPWDDVEEGGDR